MQTESEDLPGDMPMAANGPAAPAPSQGNPDHTSGVKRTAPEISENRAALVKQLLAQIKKGKAHFKDDFKRMREDMDLAYEGAAKAWVARGFYVANIVQAHIRTKVGDLYAKNPRAEWQRRPRLDFALWDGSQQQLMGAIMMGAMGDPNSLEILMDYQSGMARKRMMEKLGETTKLLFHYYIDEQTPAFKEEMKQAVRRAISTGVAYVTPGYRRVADHTPEQRMRLADMRARLAHLHRISADIEDKVIDPAVAGEIEELEIQIRDMQTRPELVLREGLAFDFDQATRVILDPCVKRIAVGFPGADWVAREFLLPPEEVQEIYGVDVRKSHMPYSASGASGAEGAEEAAYFGQGRQSEKMCMVWVMQHRKHGLEYHLCDGYKDFLKDPEAPEFEVEGFFRTVPIVLNQIEHEGKVYPPSDVYMLRHPQAEYNRSRQMLREHRRANRPAYVASKGALSDEDMAKLSSHPANAVIELEGMTPGDKVGDIIQAKPVVPIDPNLYETSFVFDDFMRTGGAQEANLGGTSGDTATESTIAESSRMSNVRSNTDDIDDSLAAVARLSGQILLQAEPKERVIEIVGPGAVWPEFSTREIMEEIWLTVRAGSSGRPNKAQDLQNWERAMPFLLQLPGLDPEWVVRETIRRLDDTLDLAEAYKPGLPSIQMLNGAKQTTGAPPDKDPNKQGGKGGDNAKKPAAESPEAAGQTGPNLNALMGGMLPGGAGAAMGLPGLPRPV